MNCKNCNFKLKIEDNFCRFCGARIERTRITIKSLISYLFDALGWESNFFVTLRYLIYQPHFVSKEYINGTRKKYTNPFTFLAISLSLSLLVLSHYSEELILMSPNIEDTTTKEFFGNLNQIEFSLFLTKIQYDYYNLISFIKVPILAFILYLVFRDPYNYSEHLVISTYLEGILLFLSTFGLIFSVETGVNIYLHLIYILPFFYYFYTYYSITKKSLRQIMVMILKLIGIMLFVLISFMLIIIILVVIKS